MSFEGCRTGEDLTVLAYESDPSTNEPEQKQGVVVMIILRGGFRLGDFEQYRSNKIGVPPGRRRQFGMDRRLTIVTVIGTVLVVSLAVSLGVVAWKYRNTDACEDGTRCFTPGCIHTASKVLENMNPEVNPCDDFYEFACGGFAKSTTIPDDKTEVNIFSEIEDELRDQMRVTIEEPIGADELRPFKMAKNLYKTCMNTSAIEKAGLDTLNKILRDLGEWPVLQGDNWNAESFIWHESIQKCLHLGYMDGYLIGLSLGVASWDSTKRVFQLDQAELSLRRQYLTRGMESEAVKTYFKHMVDIAVALGANEQKAVQELTESLGLEIKLANISWSDEARRNLSALDNPMSISELNKRYPMVKWEQMFNGILPPSARVSVDDIVNVMVPSYIRDFENIMKITPKRTVANYLLWRVVADSVRFLTKDLRNRETEYQTMIGAGERQTEARWEECLGIVSESMSISMGALYVRNHFKGDAKEKADEMMNDIRNAFVEILKEAAWMDEETRKSALEKVGAMASHIAYPHEFRDDKKLEEYYASLVLEPNDLLGNLLNLNIFESHYLMKHLNDPVNKTDWITHGLSTTVNAFYDVTENSIQVPAGILQGSLFKNDRPRYMNYGAMGHIMGHEITHGFDTDGSLYNKEGNMVNWWNRETKEKYLKNAECIAHQYGNYTDKSVDLKLDGMNTQGENIADNGGSKQAYLAYKNWAKRNGPEQSLPGLKYTPEQMFWISAANVWCTKYREDSLKNDIETDVHSPGRFRVIGPFSNRPEFSADFNCPSGSPMNPVEKCSVW